MTEFVPSGHISIREAVNRIGRELFHSAWTGEEHKARTGLISEDEWLRIKDLPPARGGDAPGSHGTIVAPVTANPHLTVDPSDPLYQAEYRASERHAAARRQLRVLLEAGHLEAAVLDPWTGALHSVSASLWRQHNADRMIKKGEAPLPRSANSGSLWVKQFADARRQAKPMPGAKIAEAVEALKQKTASESLTRPQQAEFVRKNYPNYRVSERQMNEIFRAVPVLPGRPRKSNKEV